MIEASPACSPMRSRRPSSRSACSRTASGMPASSILVRYSSTTEPSSSPSSLRIDSICWRRKYSRCCFGALLDVLADALAHLQLGQALALQAQRQLQALDDVERLQQLDLLLEGEVGRVAGGVGERAGLGDRAHEGARRGRRRRAARGSPRPRRGTRARARACGRRTGTSSGRSSTSTRRRPCDVGVGRAGDAAVRRPDTVAAWAPPGRRTRSATSATVPTAAKSSSWRGTSRTRSSSPASTGRVTSIVGKTTVSSSGMRRSDVAIPVAFEVAYVV